MSTSTARADARRRHPSARWPVPLDHLRGRVAQWLELDGSPHPEVAARVLEARGRTGLGADDYAAVLGIDSVVLRRVENGEIAATELPTALQGLGRARPLPPGHRPFSRRSTPQHRSDT